MQRCIVGRMKDLAIDDLNREKAVRGKRARNSGNSFEREIVHKLGPDAKRVGQYGGKTDVESPWIAIQAKCGNGFFPSRLDAALRAINARGDQLRAVVVGDKPGAGTRRRALIVLDFDDFIAWYGGGTDAQVTPED